jgi:hypothetical protein
MRATAAALRVGRCRHEDQQRDESTDAEQLMGFHMMDRGNSSASDDRKYRR